jgi:hypothetical protein
MHLFASMFRTHESNDCIVARMYRREFGAVKRKRQCHPDSQSCCTLVESGTHGGAPSETMNFDVQHAVPPIQWRYSDGWCGGRVWFRGGSAPFSLAVCVNSRDDRV